MGVVYEAEDLLVHEQVALKAIRPEHARDPKAIARFRRELQLARKVTHPNVCRIFDVVIADGATFLTMELVRGQSLADILHARGKLATTEALRVIEQLAAALDA